MRIGVLKEIKDNENRVGLTPLCVKELCEVGNKVIIEDNAGVGSGFSNEDYINAGASIARTPEEAWNAELVVKIKEPLKQEYKYFREGMILFTYLHLAGVDLELTKHLLKKKVTGIAYETVEDKNGRLPLLAPMSAIAGNMAITIGSYYLMNHNKGKGVQLGRVMGKASGKVVIIGDGTAGQHAANAAYGIGTNVYLLAKNNYGVLKEKYKGKMIVLESNNKTVWEHVKNADIVIGAVLITGDKAPKIVTEEMVRTMEKGSVIVDISIDQGGCIETSMATKHSEPVFIKHGIIHYCVTNMPGAYPKTSTIALTNATLPYIKELSKKCLDALKEDKGFAKGVNTCNGYITNKSVANGLGMNDNFKGLGELIQ